ncbi:hypothetical protein NEHOM01_1837 [Nematocida homosporus]|uniref:uncharacterized protein n=1 Tax=Nematocida homosporus TaxID=1912981 RepID=UPI002220A677|nr:uncharacterized protein NEHOM01_1837 [Nematocida homosporus]KAI5186979.1 hypothetical protein NEHOM01_1837 [Nematocida homosporus]
MLLSLQTNKPFRSHTQCKSRSDPAQFTELVISLNNSYLKVLTHFIASSLAIKDWCFKPAGREIMLGLFALLVLWTSVSGSNNAAVATRHSEADMKVSQDLQHLTEMVRDLEMIGFDFDNGIVTVHNNILIPDQLLNSSGSNPITTIPKYLLVHEGRFLYFELPNELDSSKAADTLNRLREVASIKTERAYVCYKIGRSNYHQTSMQIICRAINMINSNSLEIDLYGVLDDELGVVPINTKACQAEAESAFSYNVDGKLDVLEFAATTNLNMLELIGTKIIVMLPISCITLKKAQCQHLYILDKLPLIDNYTISFTLLPIVSIIDCRFLQTTYPSRCAWIRISDSKVNTLMLNGLTDDADQEARISLNINWGSLWSLLSNKNYQIRVHIIIIDESDQDSIHRMILAPHRLTSSSSRIYATKAFFQLSDNQPCRATEQFSQIYTKDNCARLGIIVHDIKIHYASRDQDLYNTIEVLHLINGVKEIPREVKDMHVTCHGEAISPPNWQLNETVDLQLSRIQLRANADIHRRICKMFFCQNIRYTTIQIRGSKTPHPHQVKECLLFLTQFQSLIANTLKIVNVRDTSQQTTNFKIPTLDLELEKSPQYAPAIKTLILDNVDESIIYWVLGRYMFSIPLDVYIFNQSFNNLAISQILTKPMSQQIESLVLNDFLKLDEVQHYHGKNQISNFSLFDYIDTAMKANINQKRLRLDKLALYPSNIKLKPYNAVLQKLLSFNLQLLFMSLSDYILCTTTPTAAMSSSILKNKKIFTLSQVTLAALEQDLTHCQAIQTTQTQFNQPQPLPVQKHVVSKLILRFHNRPSLTEKGLILILRWTACRFKDVTTLSLANISLSTKKQELLVSRHYLVRGLGSLSNILLEDKSPYPAESLAASTIPLYYNNLLATNPNTIPEFTAVSSTLLVHLISQKDKIDDIVPKHLIPKESFDMVIRSIKKNGSSIDCIICTRTLYIPSHEADSRDQTTQPPPFNPDDNFITLCYLKCKHFTCIRCIIQDQNNNRCSECRAQDVYVDIHRLIALSPSNLVFAEGYTVSPADQQWLQNLPWNDNKIYFYQSYESIESLDNDLNQEPASITSIRVYIV